MSDKPETLADILAEMRREERPYGISNDRLRFYADRIEAAAERERNAHTNDIHDALYKATGIPGNAAAMREALKEQSRYWWSHIRNYSENEMLKRTDAALAAPARNCDRFSDCNSAWKAYNAIADRERLPGFDFWLFATAEGCAK